MVVLKTHIKKAVFFTWLCIKDSTIYSHSPCYEAYGWSRHKTSLILNPSISQRPVVNFTTWLLYPRERTLVPTQQEAGCTPKPVWTFWSREKFVAGI
jgi:hypothetical protein